MKYKPIREIKKSKKDQDSDEHCDSSKWEYVEGLQRSQTTKRSCTKQIESQPSSQSSRHLYLYQFLVFIHHYIYDIVDVGQDGNCGF